MDGYTQPLTYSGIVEHCQMILWSYECDWVDCEAVLNSWESYQKHMFTHVKQAHTKKKNNPSIYTCHLPRCTHRLHDSRKNWKTHVNKTHIAKVPLHCPVKDCPKEFTVGQRGGSLLATHIEHEHDDAVTEALLSPSPFSNPLLRRSTEPTPRPRKPPLLRLPELPRELLQTIKADPLRISSFPMHPDKLRPIDRKCKYHRDDGRVSRKLRLEPLPFQEVDKKPEPPNYHVRAVRPEQPTQLSGPGPTLDPPLQSTEPDQTILFPAFFHRFMKDHPDITFSDSEDSDDDVVMSNGDS